MRNILVRPNRAVLEAFAASRMLLALDFDGTLAPIVAQPDRASPRARTRRLLAELVQRYPCVVISGRGRDDLLHRLAGIAVAGAIGNHGLETERGSSSFRRTVRGWLAPLRRRLTGLEGVVVEDKGASLAVHYRHAADRRAARARVLGAASALPKVRLVGGKAVVNLLPEGGANKGRALEAARERFGCDTALYVGDDETDEDVFALDQPGRLLGVRVGRSRRSAASYFIPGQRDIDALLAALLSARTATPAAPGAPR